MTTYRMQLQAIIDTEAHASLGLANAEAALVTRPHRRFAVKTDTMVATGQPRLVVDADFSAAADRDAVWSWASTALFTHPVTSTWTSSAWLVRHRCTHDDAVPRDCRTTDYEEQRK